jgi:tRNA 2-thiouridine synthesizing protein E
VELIMSDALIARLDAIDRKLDGIITRQRYYEDLIKEMTPIGREVVKAASGQLGELEAKGYFAVGRELLTMVDRVVTTYGAEDVHQLGEHIVQILDTVKNVTQSDVLEMANDATDVLHNADQLQPVSMFGAARATGDADVQRGLAVAIELLRHLGRSHGGSAPARHASSPATAPRTSRPAPTGAAEPVFDEPREVEEVVEWEGRRFDSNGFLLDSGDWDEDLAAKMAAGLGIDLGEDHWTVVRWARGDYLASNASPNVRRVALGSGVGTRRMYELFPRSPGKTAALIAGIPKPVGCV